MEDVFPESLGQKCGCVVYTGVHYTQQNMVYLLKRIKIYLLKLFSRTKIFFSPREMFYLFIYYVFIYVILAYSITVGLLFNQFPAVEHLGHSHFSLLLTTPW